MFIVEDSRTLYTNMGSYEPGELVFSSEPFCHIVKSNVKSGVCDYCLYVQSDENQCSMKQCSGCKLVYYCGPPKIVRIMLNTT